MKVMRVVIEKTNLFQQKEQVIAHISLDPIKGEVIIKIFDQKLEAELRKYIGFSNDFVKAEAIREETLVVNQLQASLSGRKLNGNAIVKDISVQEY